MEYYIGKIFEEIYPVDAAQWCNEQGNCHIEMVGDVYKIVENHKETEEEKQQRIAKISLTAADVERALYKAFGKDFDDIMAFAMANPPQGLDVKALKIELKANNFYRGNPYVNAVGALLGFTEEQLDKFFETNDYTYLLPVEEETNEEN